jgi:hypothetical protein
MQLAYVDFSSSQYCIAVLPVPKLGPQCSDRSFGGHIEWKVAPGKTREEC